MIDETIGSDWLTKFHPLAFRPNGRPWRTRGNGWHDALHGAGTAGWLNRSTFAGIDLYALGVILLRNATARTLPFSAADLADGMGAPHLWLQPIQPAERVTGLPPGQPPSSLAAARGIGGSTLSDLGWSRTRSAARPGCHGRPGDASTISRSAKTSIPDRLLIPETLYTDARARSRRCSPRSITSPRPACRPLDAGVRLRRRRATVSRERAAEMSSAPVACSHPVSSINTSGACVRTNNRRCRAGPASSRPGRRGPDLARRVRGRAGRAWAVDRGPRLRAKPSSHWRTDALPDDMGDATTLLLVFNDSFRSSAARASLALSCYLKRSTALTSPPRCRASARSASCPSARRPRIATAKSMRSPRSRCGSKADQPWRSDMHELALAADPRIGCTSS